MKCCHGNDFGWHSNTLSLVAKDNWVIYGKVKNGHLLRLIYWFAMNIWFYICGVIKQNQSEVGHIQFTASYFAENPIEIEQPVQKISAFKEFPKQKETKGNTSFVWLYLKINISDFRLILLDHITNKEKSTLSKRLHLICVNGTFVYDEWDRKSVSHFLEMSYVPDVSRQIYLFISSVISIQFEQTRSFWNYWMP